jgi:Ferritin-like domain
MAPNRITRGGATLAGLLLILLVAGCGGGGTSTVAPAANAPGGSGSGGAAGTATEVSVPTASPQSADAALLDKVLARQEAAVDAYAKVMTGLSPHLSHMAFYFRAQEQEHVDAVLKAMRGEKIPAEPTPEPIEPGELKSERERLVFLYEVESATIDEELSAISRLEATWPRSLLASTVADQAQHLTLLRQALGAGPLTSVPVPFENGTTPPPE